MTTEILVFGSNLHGRHGKGAVLTAVKEYGAIYGRGVGIQGNAYAIPTKETPYLPLPLKEIAGYVAMFIQYAKAHPKLTFRLTPIQPAPSTITYWEGNETKDTPACDPDTIRAMIASHKAQGARIAALMKAGAAQ